MSEIVILKRFKLSGDRHVTKQYAKSCLGEHDLKEMSRLRHILQGKFVWKPSHDESQLILCIKLKTGVAESNLEIVREIRMLIHRRHQVPKVKREAHIKDARKRKQTRQRVVR